MLEWFLFLTLIMEHPTVYIYLYICIWYMYMIYVYDICICICCICTCICIRICVCVCACVCSCVCVWKFEYWHVCVCDSTVVSIMVLICYVVSIMITCKQEDRMMIERDQVGDNSPYDWPILVVLLISKNDWTFILIMVMEYWWICWWIYLEIVGYPNSKWIHLCFFYLVNDYI